MVVSPNFITIREKFDTNTGEFILFYRHTHLITLVIKHKDKHIAIEAFNVAFNLLKEQLPSILPEIKLPVNAQPLFLYE